MEKILILPSGLPGNMIGEFVAAAAQAEDIELATAGLGLEYGFFKVPAQSGRFIPDIKVIEKGMHEALLEASKDSGAIIMDFTWPESAVGNAELYCRHGRPFVMGTTMKPEDRKRIEDIVASSETSALIAPNMAKQIVALQWAVEEFAKNNAGLLKGYTLEVIESHQKGKKDTSGTAKAMVKYFNQLGIDYNISQIEKTMMRDVPAQLKMGVPEQYLKGHGWHTYVLTFSGRGVKSAITLADPELYFPTGLSAFDGMRRGRGEVPYEGKIYNAMTFESDDKTLFFMFGFSEDGGVIITHNINGRKPYALGALDAVRFLDARVKEGNKGKAYSMIDVLKGR